MNHKNLWSLPLPHFYQNAIENRDLISNGLQEKRYQIITPIKKREERTAIIHFTTGSLENTKRLYQKLINKNVLVTLQGENIRVSPNFFTTKEEIKIFLYLI